MLQFHNQTPFEGKIFATPDQTGVDSIYAVVKATFRIGGRIDIAEKQAPVSLKDEYLGEPGKKQCAAFLRTLPSPSPAPMS